MKVDIANGKYTYVLHDGGAELLRLGETWEDVTGQKVWYCTAYELQEVREERDALAAHVERWREWLARDPEDDEGSWMDDGWEIHASSPETSLAKLKAQWQAEVLYELMALIGAGASTDEVSDWLVSESTRLHGQAGGEE